jgi:hypothetical protein
LIADLPEDGQVYAYEGEDVGIGIRFPSGRFFWIRARDSGIKTRLLRTVQQANRRCIMAWNEHGEADPPSTAIDFDLRIAEMRANVSRLKEAMAVTAESYSLYAQQYRRYFETLVAEGFTSEQALSIVMTQGWVPK